MDSDYEDHSSISEEYTEIDTDVDIDYEFFTNSGDDDYNTRYLLNEPLMIDYDDFNNENVTLNVERFINLFDLRYNIVTTKSQIRENQTLQFYKGTLKEAMSSMNDTCKPLAIYLHEDNICGRCIFPSQILLNPAISGILNSDFTLFPWDCKSESRLKYIRQALLDSSLSVDFLDYTQLPVILLIGLDEEYSFVKYGQISYENTNDVIGKLEDARDRFNSVLINYIN